MKNDYTLKEILLGLRNEQVKVANRLEELKTNLERNKSTEKSFFTIENDDIAIIYTYMYKAKPLKWDFVPFRLKRNLDGDFSNFYLSIAKGKQFEFNAMCDDLLKDEFVKNSCFVIQTNHGKLRINPSQTHYFIEDSKLSRINNFTYFAKNDSILVEGDIFFKDRRKKVNDLLNTSIPKENFSDYLQNIIDESEESKKDILISDDKIIGQKMHFYLNQERENYVLVKKKK